jgi:hypothetical protein
MQVHLQLIPGSMIGIVRLFPTQNRAKCGSSHFQTQVAIVVDRFVSELQKDRKGAAQAGWFIRSLHQPQFS